MVFMAEGRITSVPRVRAVGNVFALSATMEPTKKHLFPYGEKWQIMHQSNSQRDFAIGVVQKLRDAGHESLWAGGCVRDELLGIVPKDYDVATSARPEQVRELFGHRRTLAIGAAFGVIAVLGSKGNDPVEVATFRSDGAYIDGRRPTEVLYTTAEEDAQRRDFTINGLFYDPIEEKLIDYVDGEQDLRQETLRAIGDPSARFAEDKLRMMRAVRFATTFQFAIDPPTLQAIHSMADEVEVVSAERIGVELRKILTHSNRRFGVELLHEAGLLRPLLPSLADMAEHDEPAWIRLLERLQALDSPTLPACLAALLCDSRSLKHVQEQGRGFRYTNKEIERTAWLVEQLTTVEKADGLPWPRLQRALVHTGIEELLALAAAAWGPEHEGLQTCRQRLLLPPEKLNPPLLLTGDDLVAHGLRPGKYFGELLAAVRDAQLEEKVIDQQQAFQLVEHWVEHWLEEHRGE